MKKIGLKGGFGIGKKRTKRKGANIFGAAAAEVCGAFAFVHRDLVVLRGVKLDLIRADWAAGRGC